MTTELWLSKVRLKWANIPILGDRYGQLRASKNRFEGFVGQFTQREVAKRLGLIPSTLEKLEAGSLPFQGETADALLKDLGMTWEQFNPALFAAPPVTVPTTVPPVQLPPVQLPPAPPPQLFKPMAEIAKPAPKTKPAPKPTEPEPTPKTAGAQAMNVVNYTTDQLIIKVSGGSINVYPADPQYKARGTLVFPADEMFGKISPRTTQLE